MSFKISFGTLSGESNKAQPRDVESPFRIGIMGDFTSRASRQVNEPIDQRKTWKIDCDNFDKVLARLEPKLKLEQADLDQPLELVFRSLEDFHPDKVVRQVHTLAGLVQKRARLADPSTAQAAAKELEQLVRPGPIAPPANTGSESNEETMARLMGGTPMTPKTAPSATPEGSVQRLIEKIVAPSLKPGTSPEQLALLSMVDLELAQRLRAILHHPDFQALETAWRGVDFLIRRFGAEENLKFSLLDVSRGELEADLLLKEDLESTGIFKHLHRQADDEAWSTCLGLYSFGASDDDFKLLGRAAKIFSHAGIPMICEAKSSLLGCESLERYPRPEEWQPENSPTLAGGLESITRPAPGFQPWPGAAAIFASPTLRQSQRPY